MPMCSFFFLGCPNIVATIQAFFYQLCLIEQVQVFVNFVVSGHVIMWPDKVLFVSLYILFTAFVIESSNFPPSRTQLSCLHQAS
jgi:hypothetical protein